MMPPIQFFSPIALALLFLTGCDRTREVAHNAPTTATNHTTLAGCWQLRAIAAKNASAESLLVQFDTSHGIGETVMSNRVLYRLDNRGYRAVRDAEGFTLQDRWKVDPRSDTIRLLFNNGLYGSHWILTPPPHSASHDSLLGTRQGFGDVAGQPPDPIQAAVAIRFPCAASTDSAAQN